MEGVGPRLGRASSRYGSSSAGFSGPVRKWKRRWVHVSYQTNSTTSRSNNYGNNNNASSAALVLRRWTPISPSDSGDNSVVTEEPPPRRKFRYVPIVALEEQKHEAVEKLGDKAKTHEAHPFEIRSTSKSDQEGGFTEEIQAATENRLTQQDMNTSRHLNVDLGLKGRDEDYESDSENDEAGESGY